MSKNNSTWVEIRDAWVKMFKTVWIWYCGRKYPTDFLIAVSSGKELGEMKMVRAAVRMKDVTPEYVVELREEIAKTLNVDVNMITILGYRDAEDDETDSETE